MLVGIGFEYLFQPANASVTYLLLWLKINNIITGRKINLLKIIEKCEKKKPEIAKDFVIPASTLSTITKK